MAAPQNVLIIDGPTETEEVVRAIFEPRGLQVGRMDSTEPHAAEPQQPTVLVLHSHRQPTPNRWAHVPCIVIGRFSPAGRSHTPSRCLSDPYDYADLIAAIDELLVGPGPAPTRLDV